MATRMGAPLQCLEAVYPETEANQEKLGNETWFRGTIENTSLVHAVFYLVAFEK